jgi:hypothetical protein
MQSESAFGPSSSVPLFGSFRQKLNGHSITAVFEMTQVFAEFELAPAL